METPRRKLDLSELGRLWHEVPAPGASPEVRQEFGDFYRSKVGGERLFEADVRDAAHLVSIYSSTLMELGRHAEAEAEARRFVDHPDLAQLDANARMDLHCKLGFCALALGREAEALAHFRRLWLSGPREDRRCAVLFTRHFLPQYLRRNGMASEPMTGFVEELVARWKGRALRRSRFPPRTTYRRLRLHIRRSYPRPKYDPADPLYAKVEAIGSAARAYIRRVGEARQEAAAERKRDALRRAVRRDGE